MTVASVIAELQRVQETIPGVRKAFAADKLPVGVNDFPCFVNVWGDDDIIDIEGGQGVYRLRYRIGMLLLVQRGGDLPTALSKLIPLFEPALAVFAANGTLHGSAKLVKVPRARPGFIVYAGVEYVGIRFSLEVHEQWSTPFTGG